MGIGWLRFDRSWWDLVLALRHGGHRLKGAAFAQYQLWLKADPLDRLLLDPSGVYADFSLARYKRVESRAVSLILASIPGHIRDEAVSNRWLASAALIFRIMCLYQPGGSSERSMLLSQLVNPEAPKSLGMAVGVLRKWQQHFARIRELQAALPDSSLLLKGVDNATAGLLGQHPALSFRVNSFRNKVALDYNPSIATVLQLVRLLQAEFEAAALSVETVGGDKRARLAGVQPGPEAPAPKGPPPKAPPHLPAEALSKALEGTNDPKGKGKGKEKGKDQGKESNVCYNFAEGRGCRYGDSCKFKHDRPKARKEKRCLARGKEGHFRPDCPIVPQELRLPVAPDLGSPTAPKHPPPKAKAKVGPVLKGVVEDGGIEPSTPASGSSATGSSQDALFAEAAKLLNQVSLKPIRLDDPLLGIDQGWLRTAVLNASDPNYALVDSGATNGLRQASEQELGDSRVIRVDLASGTTELHVNRFGTLLSPRPCQVIVPAGYLVQLGYAIAWRKKGCYIQKGKSKPLEVEVVKGCPLIPRDKGIQLLDEYERKLELGELVMMKPIHKPAEGLTRGTSRQWLAAKVGQGVLTRGDQLAWLKVMFPEVPDDYLYRVPGLDVDLRSPPADDAPWNRRKRRSCMRARRGEVLVHLFAGEQRWKGQGLVVEVERSRGVDLMSVGVWQHLLTWALRGVIGGVVGGPPCRTVSCCRAYGDGGPPPVRGRLQGRWGLPSLSGDLQALVRDDSVLWLRFLMLYSVAQAAADASSPQPVTVEASEERPIGLPKENPEELVQGIESVPEGMKDPLEIAKWALRQAAERLKARSENSKAVGVSISGGRPGFVVFFGWEQPSDPRSFMPPSGEPVEGWATWWEFEEWKHFASQYCVFKACFDQGKLGHVRPKPTTFATTSWKLYEELDQLFLTTSERAAFGKGPVTSRERIREASSWARWAPGLTSRVVAAWRAWKQENGLWPEAGARRLLLNKLTEEEAMKRHEASDHSPFRRGCPVCVASQGRQRSHWRASFAGLYSLSVDIAGPFKPGRFWDPVASGRDKGLGYRYFLAAAFTIPLKFGEESPKGATEEPIAEIRPDSSEPPEVLVLERPEGPMDGDIPSMEELFGDDGEVDPVGAAPGSETVLRAVSHRFRVKKPEPEEALEELPEPPLPPPAEAPPYPKTRTLFLGTPLRTRNGKEALGAVQALINRLEASGFPVHRYHSDSAKELRSKDLVAWLRDQGIHHTWTPGENPAGNKAELAVQQLKAAGRKLLATAALTHDLWPFAVCHASNRNWVQVSELLGLPVVHLLPFGLSVQARRRLKHTDRSSWSVKTLPGQYLGQAPHTPGGHLVWVKDADEGSRVLLTNTVYPVALDHTEKGRPKYRLRDKTGPEFVLRAVSAVPVSTSRIAPVLPSTFLARLSPGGEWEVVTNGEDREGEDEEDLILSKVERGSALLQQRPQQLERDSALSGQRPQQLGRESALLEQRPQFVERDSALHKQRVSGQRGEGGCKAAYSMPQGLKDLDMEQLRRHSTLSKITFVECYEILQEWFRSNSEGTGVFDSWECSFLMERGSRVAQSAFPVMSELLEGLVEGCMPGMEWTQMLLVRNSPDLRGFGGDAELEGSVWIVTLGEFQGGGLWIEGEAGEGSVIKVMPPGTGVAGDVVNVRGLPVQFQGRRRHFLESWMGGDLWALKVFCSGVTVSQRPKGSEELGIEVRRSQASADEGSWEVDFPHFIATKEWRQGAASLHEAAVYLQTKLFREFLDRGLDLEGLFPVSRSLVVASLDCSWFERALELGRLEGVSVMVRSVESEIPLREPDPNPADQFLQTRTVSLDEARQELELWKPAALEEVTALEETTRAVERVSSETVEGWVKQGWRIVQVPGKAVLTRKAGVGKRRLRAVCCGNHIPSEQVADKKADLYAGGIDALTVRVVLAFAAQQKQWEACVVDVKTAFLYAPVRSSEGEGKQVPTIIVKPPYLLVQLGVMESTDRWRVRRALYGLQTSPRDWAVYRDKELRGISVATPVDVCLKQGLTDDSLWFIKSRTGHTLGLMIVYVDDIALFWA